MMVTMKVSDYGGDGDDDGGGDDGGSGDNGEDDDSIHISMAFSTCRPCPKLTSRNTLTSLFHR
jgi:hypothetical protein